MDKSDVFLGEEQVSVIKALEIAIEQESNPDIQLDPDSSEIRLGGGSSNSGGNLRLTDGDDNVRINVTGSGEPWRPPTTRVRINGDNGNVRLGAKGLEYGEGLDATDIKFSPNSASLRLGGGRGDHSEGDLRLTDKDDDVRIHASGGEGHFDLETSRILLRGDDGTLKLGSDGLEDEDGNDIADVTLNPKRGSLTLGGGGDRYSDGDIKLQDRDGNNRVHIHGSGAGATNDETTSLYVDGEKGSLHFRPPNTDSDQSAPMLYMYSGPTGDGVARDFTGDDFPQTRPIVVTRHSPHSRHTGLFYESNKFVVRGYVPDDDSDLLRDNRGIPLELWDPDDLWDPRHDEPEEHEPFTADIVNNRVGVRTTDPRYALDVEGHVNANNVGTVSDARCKQNIEPLSDCLETVQELRGVRYDWDDKYADHDFDDERHIGFVAQELADVLPEAVTTGEDDLRSTIGDAITPVLAEAIKEQQEIIDSQQETIERQQGAIDELGERVAELERRTVVTQESNGAESNIQRE